MADLAATCERIALQLAAELQREVLRKLRPRRRRRAIAVRPPPRELQPAEPGCVRADGTLSWGHEDELGHPVDYVMFCG